ncbi:hypothetical protein BC826DRAFT_1108997 [Russula brevipes]|nr:hypothetical protein BC826DRAFT_1108997 [Russula brevipes]
MDLGPHRATKGPTVACTRPPDDAIAGRAQSDEPLDGAAVTGATSSQQAHSKEARPTDNQTTAVTVAPPRGRPTTAGRRNANELGIEPDSRPLGDQVRPLLAALALAALNRSTLQQPAVGVDNSRHAVTRPIPPTGSPSVSASREPQAKQNERITTPGSISSSASMKLHTHPHPAAIPPSSGIAPPTRASQYADSKTSRRPPQAEEQEKRSRSPVQIGFAREKDASGPSPEQVDRTASVQPSAKPFAHPSPSLNRPGVSASPSSYPAAQTLIKTASTRMQVVLGTPRDEPQARSGTALSELVPTPDEDKRKAPPYEQGPMNPLGTQAKLPQPSGNTPSSTEPLSRHEPVPKPGHLDRSHSRKQGNEAGDREDKRAKGGANPRKEQQLPVTPDERGTHLGDTVKASGNASHVRSELSTSANASGIAQHVFLTPADLKEKSDGLWTQSHPSVNRKLHARRLLPVPGPTPLKANPNRSSGRLRTVAR